MLSDLNIIEDEIYEDKLNLQDKLFSPGQILLGTIIGGLTAGIYFLAKNYESMRDYRKRNITYYIGFISLIIVVSTVIYMDLKISGSALAVGLGVGLSQYTKIYFKENNIKVEGNFFQTIEDKNIQQSADKVILGIIVGIITGLIIGLAIAFTFKYLGFDIK